MSTSRARRLLVGTLTYAGIIAVTLLVVDGISIAFGLFPPQPNYGDPDLGWRPARATGAMSMDQCIEPGTGRVIRYQRNEDGVRIDRAREALRRDTSDVKIAVVGDSQTELCSPNAELHAGVLQATLRADGIPALVLPYGAGRYSPLQAYLAFRTVLRPYGPELLVMNVYTGNDLYDLLRSDDRPHLVTSDTGYYIAPPVWYTYQDPAVSQRSRVLYALREMGEMTGVRRLYLRLAELRRLGAQQGAGLGTVLRYMRDLWKARTASVGYPDAFAAQMLNQQLFFHHFEGASEESIDRMSALMTLIRSDNPGLVLVMSPIPSYELVGGQPVDEPLVQTLERLPVSYAEGQRQEETIYNRLRTLAAAQGWVFVDNLTALRAYHGSGRLYNNFDYHLLPAASKIVGEAQAAAVLPVLCERYSICTNRPVAPSEPPATQPSPRR